MVIRNAKIYIKKFFYTYTFICFVCCKEKQFKTVPFSNGIFMLVSVSTYRYFCHIISGAVSWQLPDSFNLWGGGCAFRELIFACKCVCVCACAWVCLCVCVCQRTHFTVAMSIFPQCNHVNAMINSSIIIPLSRISSDEITLDSFWRIPDDCTSFDDMSF